MRTRVALTPLGWGTLLTALALALAWWVIGLRDVLYLAAVLTALLPLAALIAVTPALLAGFRANITTSSPTPHAGDPLHLSVGLTHRFPVPLRAFITLTLGRQERTVPVRIRARGVTHVRVEWAAPSRGPAHAAVREVLTRDPLGLIGARTRLDARIPLLVLPRLVDLPLLPRAPHVRERGSEGRTTLRSPSGFPGGALRAYRSGDALRQIHWKQSARQGEMLVNLPESERETDTTILLVTSSEGYRTPAEFDDAVSAAATLALHWLNEGRTVRLHHGLTSQVFTEEGPILRHLAVVRHENRPPEEAPTGAVTAIAGTLTRRVSEQLAALTPGVVLALRTIPSVGIPRGWHLENLGANGAGDG
ncbi:MAG: DUF58 domain-containing protein [bacterium]|nr:DUF58 domain-containing protein [bacterium]